jgi:hypothetical protein
MVGPTTIYYSPLEWMNHLEDKELAYESLYWLKLISVCACTSLAIGTCIVALLQL